MFRATSSSSSIARDGSAAESLNGRSTRNSRPPGAQVCDIFDCGIDKEQKLCHFLMPDLSVAHQEPPKEASVPHERVVEELLKYHIRWWNDPRLDEWPFMQRAGVR